MTTQQSATIIDNSTIKKAGNLGRIFSNQYADEHPQELAKFVPSLVGIMNFIDNLCTIDASSYSPFDSIKKVGIEDLRDDTPDTSADYERIRENIRANFPVRQGDFLQLPVRIIESS